MPVRTDLGKMSMPASRSPAKFASLFAALALAACVSVEQDMIERGYAPAYAKGYDGGCTSGKEAAGGLFAAARKDTSRYGTDDQYTDGWNDGFEECRRQMVGMVLDARRRNPSRDK